MKVIASMVIIITIIHAIKHPIFLGSYGKSYEIKEADWLVELTDKAAKFQKDANISQKLNEIIDKKVVVDMQIPSCEEEREYENKLIYSYGKDVIFQGTTIYKKGTEVNLLEKIPLIGYIVAMDVATDDDKELLFKIIKDYTNMIRVYVTKGDIRELQLAVQNEFPLRNNIIVGKAQKKILETLKVTCVPTVAFQKNGKLILNTINLNSANDEK